MSSKTIHVLLADERAIVRKGIRDFLEATPDIRVVAEAVSGVAAWEMVSRTSPDVAIFGMNLPELGGVQLAKRIRQHAAGVRMLILSAHNDESHALAVLHAGADGYILMTATGESLIRAVRQVYAGQCVLDPETALKVVTLQQHGHRILPLSPRELEIVRQVAEGRTNRDIAHMLAISDRTVQGHLAKLYAKMHVSTRTALVTAALQRGIITLEETAC
jgi:DNA-binding NarL/FixJ family response regulator